jgi:hypothetical protein
MRNENALAERLQVRSEELSTDIQPSTMTVTVGASETLTDYSGDPLDDCIYPDVPLGADSEYDSWLS